MEAICSFLAARTTELETDAYPALDELTSKVSTYVFPLSLTGFLTVFCSCPHFQLPHPKKKNKRKRLLVSGLVKEMGRLLI